MKPMKRNPVLNKFIDSISAPSKKATKGIVESIEENFCAWCGEKVDEFRDELSKKEYTISGLCQKCQDEVFGR